MLNNMMVTLEERRIGVLHGTRNEDGVTRGIVVSWEARKVGGPRASRTGDRSRSADGEHLYFTWERLDVMRFAEFGMIPVKFMK